MARIKTFSNMKLLDIELKINAMEEHNDIIAVEFFPKKDDLYDAVLTYEPNGLEISEEDEDFEDDDEEEDGSIFGI